MNVPIHTLHLFSILDQKLIELLHSLQPADWTKPTRAKLWRVKDVASHLLDTNIRTISTRRDNYKSEEPSGISSYNDLVNYLNQLNADWVKATKRISPQLLTTLLELTGKEYIQQLNALDLWAPAPFSVAWAGEEASFNWFHIAREYTEKWHHQQQIREAVYGDIDNELMSRVLYFPVLDTFMRALPHAYRNTAIENDKAIQVSITGEAGGNWFLLRKNNNWELAKSTEQVIIKVTLDAVDAWKLFTKGMTLSEASNAVKIEGDKELGKPILSMVCVMA